MVMIVVMFVMMMVSFTVVMMVVMVIMIMVMLMIVVMMRLGQPVLFSLRVRQNIQNAVPRIIIAETNCSRGSTAWQ